MKTASSVKLPGWKKKEPVLPRTFTMSSGPLLAAVKMKINSFELADPEDEVRLEKTTDHIDDILKRMREISFDLMPNTLLKKGLVTALIEYM